MNDRSSTPTASWTALRRRAEILASARRFFAERDFLEVETPLLSGEVVVEAHIDPIKVSLPSDVRRPAEAQRMWLQASPEAGMKRLFATLSADAAGEPEEAAPRAIYQIARAFRAGEAGEHHNPEFTLVEWYRLGDNMADGMQLLDELCQALLECEPAERVSYREAFLTHAEIDPHTAAAPVLAQVAAASGVAAPADLGDDRDAWLDLLLTDLVMPQLTGERPILLYDYPASQAALARVDSPEPSENSAGAADVGSNESPKVAKRFELFYRGLELANGYWELLDADELRKRTGDANAARRIDGRAELPAPERLLAAMAGDGQTGDGQTGDGQTGDGQTGGLPPCSGCALGLDRVVMLATDAKSIAEVIALPTSRA